MGSSQKAVTAYWLQIAHDHLSVLITGILFAFLVKQAAKLSKVQRKLVETLVANDKIAVRFNRVEIEALCRVYNDSCELNHTSSMDIYQFRDVFGIRDASVSLTTDSRVLVFLVLVWLACFFI